MIVNLRLRRLEIVLRLERQQMASPTRLKRLVRPCCAETHGSRRTHATQRVYNNV